MMDWVQATNDNFIITVSNNAWFVAEFYVTYKINGQSYNLDSGMFAIGTSRTLNIPKNADSAYITIDMQWLGGQHLYNQVGIPMQNNCFNLTGSIFNPSVQEIPCSGLGGNGSGGTNNQCCCCCCCKNKIN